MGCALAIVFQVRSLYVPTKDRSLSWGHFLESLVIKITFEIGQNHLSIEAQCDHHTSGLTAFLSVLTTTTLSICQLQKVGQSVVLFPVMS